MGLFSFSLGFWSGLDGSIDGDDKTTLLALDRFFIAFAGPPLNRGEVVGRVDKYGADVKRNAEFH